MADQFFRTIAWLEARIEAAHSDAGAHPKGSGNRSFYRGQAIAYENALSALQTNARLSAEPVTATEA